MRLKNRSVEGPASPADASAEQAYAVRCRCGRVSEGLRQPKPQVVHCPGCGDPLFVMSRSAFPPVSAGRRGAAGRRLRTGATVEAAAGAPPAFGEGRRRFVSPRLAAMAVCLLVAATVWWGWRSRQRAMFAAELESATAAGREALRKGDFVAAYQRLEVADRAARGLGLRTAAERSAAHLFAETQTWMNLAPRSVEEFFFVRSTQAPPWDAASVGGEFARDYQGRAVIVDGYVTRVERWITPPSPPPSAKKKRPAPPAQPRQEFVPTLDWSVAGDNYQVQMLLEQVRALDHLPREQPTRVLFGVELARLERAADDPQKWTLHVAPESFTLLTVSEPLFRYGWPEGDDAAAVLAQQQAHLEQAP